MVDEETNPWQTLASEQRYANAWIEVTHHDVITPGGSPGIYGTVHFQHLAIGILPIDAEGVTWLVGQYRYPLQHYSWEIPEGGGELNVTPLESAQRELKEETGLEAARWELIMELDLSNSVTDEHAYIFLARDLTPGQSAPEDTEDLSIRRLPFAEAYAMTLDGRITDAMSVAALQRYQLLLNESKAPL